MQLPRSQLSAQILPRSVCCICSSACEAHCLSICLIACSLHLSIRCLVQLQVCMTSSDYLGHFLWVLVYLFLTLPPPLRAPGHFLPRDEVVARGEKDILERVTHDKLSVHVLRVVFPTFRLFRRRPDYSSNDVARLKYDLYDFFRGCFGPASCSFSCRKGPKKHPLKSHIDHIFRRAQIR